MIQEIAAALAQSWENLASAFVLFVPRLIAAAIIFAAGFVVAVIARRIVRIVLTALNFDRLAARTGASEMLRVAEMPTADPVAKIIFGSSGRVSSSGRGRCSSRRFKTGRSSAFVPGSCWRCRCSPWIPAGQLRLARHVAGVGQRGPAARLLAARCGSW